MKKTKKETSKVVHLPFILEDSSPTIFNEGTTKEHIEELKNKEVPSSYYKEG